MKSSFELAMERLAKAAPTHKLTASQKKEIAELESKYAPKSRNANSSLRRDRQSH